ncbi:cold-shock protein [Grosmannia clavigera kw1407]|uniref:Cold-shock protein n=1 Tax=Grosmannia clavigera (strain kw1407 / UAMH 11150) TaxID=655863 RepID=F0XFF3_GROCL|nr:cold-shock protein [Grosmannia clavigera kw1407]EFX03781.1 cold-shock protein [Grosmannia clavigera kw1407]
MTTGTVKSFNEAKGFGFITASDGSGDYYAQFASIVTHGFKTLKVGEHVNFVPSTGPHGREAKNIRIIS